MSVQLLNITFNLSPGRTDGPSVTIRRNARDNVRLPEWRLRETFTSEQCPIAYSNAQARDQTVSIRVRLSGPAGTSFRVRALGPDRAEQARLGCALMYFYWLMPFSQWQSFSVLGEIEPFVIFFPQTQTVAQFSEAELTVELSGHSIGARGVWVSDTNWRWQYLDESGIWRDIITTRHRVYCLDAHPTLPWQQDYMAGANPRLPWVDALEVACAWAAGAHNADDVARAICRGVWNAGSTGLLRYDPSRRGDFADDENRGGRFDLSLFLSHLRSGTAARSVQCFDCAAAVSTLANILGADLDQYQFTIDWAPDDTRSKPVLLIGHSNPTRATWITHEVVSVPTPPSGSRVWDACLQLNAPSLRPPVTFVGRQVLGMTFADYRVLFLTEGSRAHDPMRGRRDLVI